MLLMLTDNGFNDLRYSMDGGSLGLCKSLQPAEEIVGPTLFYTPKDKG